MYSTRQVVLQDIRWRSRSGVWGGGRTIQHSIRHSQSNAVWSPSYTYKTEGAAGQAVLRASAR